MNNDSLKINIEENNKELKIKQLDGTVIIAKEEQEAEIETEPIPNIDIDILSNEMNIDTPKIEIKKEEDHSKLKNLEFANSGHTGFASSEDINKINQELLNFVSYNKQNKNDIQKTTARNNILAKRDIIDLGIIDFADYDDDFDTFMNTLLNEGEYKFSDTDFTYYVKVVDLGEVVGQEYCSSEEGYALRYFRTIYFDDTGNFDYAVNWDSFMTSAIANSAYAPKNHVHYKVLNTASTIKTYLDSFTQWGEFSISSTADKEKYWVFTDYYNVTVNGKTENRRIQRYYSMSEPWKIYSRFGLYNNSTKKITWQDWHVLEGVIE